MNDYCAVIGGVNMDIGGKSFSKLLPKDSSPGTVSLNPGGVGRNIAHNLSLMGVPVKLLTALGNDLYGQKLAASCGELGIDLSHALRLDNAVTSTYLYLADADGDMALAVSDMAICEALTPDYVRENLSLLQRARLVVADANIPADTLAFLAETLSVPLFCDPVSVAKAEKLRPILSKIHTLKPNRLEAAFLTGIPLNDVSDAKKAAKRLIELGVKRIFLSLGSEGMVCADETECFSLPCLPATTVSATGCGDAAMAAIVWAFTEQLSLHNTALAALAAGSLALESRETVNPRMSSEAIRQKMKESAQKEQV